MIVHGLDWLSFGVEEVVLEPFKSIPGLKQSQTGGAFHQHGLQCPGLKVFFDPKPGCQNHKMQVEMKGEFFRVAPGLGEALFNQFIGADISCHPYRIDYRMDVIDKPGEMHPAFFPEDFQPLPMPNGKTRSADYYYDEMGNWTGLKMGKADVVIRIYDKAKEQQSKEGIEDFGYMWSWWRLECQLRGDTLKAHLQDPMWIDNGIFRFAAAYGQKAMCERLRLPEFIAHEFKEAETNNWSVLPREKQLASRVQWRMNKIQRLLKEVEQWSAASEAREKSGKW